MARALSRGFDMTRSQEAVMMIMVIIIVDVLGAGVWAALSRHGERSAVLLIVRGGLGGERSQRDHLVLYSPRFSSPSGAPIEQDGRRWGRCRDTQRRSPRVLPRGG